MMSRSSFYRHHDGAMVTRHLSVLLVEDCPRLKDCRLKEESLFFPMSGRVQIILAN